MKRTHVERSTHPARTPGELDYAIRQRAYELYEERGMTDGAELEDWLQAGEEYLEDAPRRS